MNVGIIVRYLFGDAKAIRVVAASKSAFWTGVVLVFITTIPRNYDQVHISENPARWVFGSLVFSLISGTWLYIFTWGEFARRTYKRVHGTKPPFWKDWPAFMGLFWMTAPIAWLYAIPVERFLDSTSSVKANLAMLAVVSVWRVLLMARVLQVLCNPPFLMALVWLLGPVSVEVFGVSFFSERLGRAVMAGMGGMRNSPEEEIITRALGNVMFCSFWCIFIFSLAGGIWKGVVNPTLFPTRTSGRMPWLFLGSAAIFWAAIAVIPQREIALNAKMDRLVADGLYRETLDVLANHRPDEFAPSRPLPPKVYERTVFAQLPEMLGTLQTNDPPYLRKMLIAKLDVMVSHYQPRWMEKNWAELTEFDKSTRIKDGFRRNVVYPDSWQRMLEGLLRIDEGRDWMGRNSIWMLALYRSASEAEVYRFREGKSEEEQRKGWNGVKRMLDRLSTPESPVKLNIFGLGSNAVPVPTNSPPSLPAP